MGDLHEWMDTPDGVYKVKTAKAVETGRLRGEVVKIL